MAAVTRTASPSLSTRAVPTGNVHRHPAHPAGVNLNPGDLVYLDGNGVWQLTNGTANTAPGIFWGICQVFSAAGEACAPLFGVEFFYADGTLTPGARYFVAAAVPGQLDTAATTGGLSPVAVAEDAYHLMFIMPRYVN